MNLAARISLIERSAEMHEAEADCLRRMHTLAPHHQWEPDDSTAQADHDQMLLVSHQLRQLARELHKELDWMHLVTGTNRIAS